MATPATELTQDKINELKDEHGPLQLITTDEDDSIIAKIPSKAVYDKYKTALFDERKRVRANEMLVRDCLVYPDRPDFNAMIETKPALIETFSTKLLELAGARETVEAKKL